MKDQVPRSHEEELEIEVAKLKHSKMDNAEQCIEQARYDLMRFNTELHDLDLMGINLNTGDLLGFADIFFDGFLSDILMQSRIKNAL